MAWKPSLVGKRLEEQREAYVDSCRAVHNRGRQRSAVCFEIRWRCWPGCAQLDIAAAPGKGGLREASIKWLAQFSQELLDALGRAAVALQLPLPTAARCILGQPHL